MNETHPKLLPGAEVVDTSKGGEQPNIATHPSSFCKTNKERETSINSSVKLFFS
jgi:hypothetical protein